MLCRVRYLLHSCTQLFLIIVPVFAAHAQCYSGTGQTYQAGMNANAAAYYSTAVGYNAQALCENSIAIGHNSLADGGPGANTAVGNSAHVSAPNGTAIGGWSTAAGNGATALGGGAYAGGDGSLAVGPGSRTDHYQATAIGTGSQTTRDYQMMFGAATNTYTLAGLASASSSAAQTGDYRYMVTSDEYGNLAVDMIPTGGSATSIIDDLTTGGTTAALSAEQGKNLNDRLTANEGLTNDMVGHVLDIGEIADAANEKADEAMQLATQASNDIAGVASIAANAATDAQTARAEASAAQATAWSAEVTANAAYGAASGALQRSGGTMTGDLNMGGNRITNVAAPIIATDAATKGYVDTAINGYSGRIAAVEDQTRRNTDGVAIAIAMGGIALPPGREVGIGANVGFFDGSKAFATQGVFKVNDSMTFNSAIGVALGADTTVGGRMGLMAAW